MATVAKNLTDQDDPNYCAHPGCHCKVEPGEKYCSVSCERQLNGGPCSCGHLNCQPEHKEMP
ncbi:MAG: hypothetical protein EPO18_17080 [Methylobacter sp.]|nr:MAG: hypothetical protein EPO18_17080 [Methylobacter sp.]